VESLLTFAEELERRDADLARALTAVERRYHDVEEVRTAGAAVAAFLDRLPTELAQREKEERSAAAEQEHATAVLGDVKPDDQLGLANAHAAFRAAAERYDRARDASEQLEQEAEHRREEEAGLATRAAGLAPDVHGVPPPEPGIAGTLEWASRARGALLVERSGLTVERETIVREASELVASVLGDAHAAVGAEGLRERLARLRPTL